MKSISVEIKIAILIIITTALAVLAGNIAYQSISQIVSSLKKEAQPNLSLVLIKDINTDLIQAESSIKYYTLTGNKWYLQPYYQVMQTINDKIEKLKAYNVESNDRIIQIDSINMLIQHKYAVWNQMLSITNKDRVDSVLSKLAVKLDSSMDTVTIKVPQNIKIIKKEQQPVNQSKAESNDGFFARLFGRKQESTEEIKVIDTSQKVVEEVISKDTVIELGIKPKLIQDEINRIREEEVVEKKKLTATEIYLARKSDALSGQLNQLIRNLEAQELKSINEQALEADKLAKSTVKLLFLFLIVFSILLIGVFYVIQRYVRKSHASQLALIKAKDEALRLTKTREQFMANISHEIRTPMHAIVGFAEQLNKQVKENNAKEQVGIIKKSAEHLNGIINDVLDFSKLESGKLIIESIPFSPVSVFNEIFLMFKPKAKEKELNYELFIDEKIPDVLIGDAMRLKQILINLVSNSFKFTSKGYIKISVEVKIIHDYANLKIKVNDSGIGISEESLKHIFEEFNQAEVSTSRKFGGTGLGLTIVKKLVNLQGGNLKVNSKPGEGTSFIIELPYLTGKELPVEQANISIRVIPELLEGIKILAVDDDEYNRRLVRQIFKNWEVDFEIVENGKKFIEEAKTGEYDLLLLDIQMPEMNGFQAAELVRKSGIKKLENIPIVALTATIAEEEIQKCKKAGINKIISKPFTESTLFETICIIKDLDITPESGDEKFKTEKPKNHVKFSNLYHLANNDENFVFDMLQMFIKTSREELKVIDQALKLKDWQEIAEHAHKIKSPCKHLDALETANLLKDIELTARNSTDKENLPKMIKIAKGQILRLINEVETYIGTMESVKTK